MPSKVAAEMDASMDAEAQREKEMMRTPVVREDMKQMENRARVSQILGSATFHHELDHIIQTLVKSGTQPSGLMELQKVSAEASQFSPGGLVRTPKNTASVAGPTGLVVTPIADLQGSNQTLYEQGEREARCKAACFYRLAEMLGWLQFMKGSFTLKHGSGYLMSSSGAMPSEITAGSLAKVDISGTVVDGGNLILGVDSGDSLLPRMLIESRPGLSCCVFSCSQDIAAVCCMKKGLLPLSQESMIAGDVSYTDYVTDLRNDQLCQTAVDSLIPSSHYLVVRNRGVYVVAEDVARAFFHMKIFADAAASQMKYAALGDEALHPSPMAAQRVQDYIINKGVIGMSSGTSSELRSDGLADLEFEAYVRYLDMTGHRTGFLYKVPVLNMSSSQLASMSTSQVIDYYKDASESRTQRHKQSIHQQRTQWMAGGGGTRLNGQGMARGDNPSQEKESGATSIQEAVDDSTASDGRGEANSSVAGDSTADMSANMQESVDSSSTGAAAGSSGKDKKKKKKRIPSFSSKKK